MTHENLINKCGLLQAKVDECTKEIIDKQMLLQAAESKLDGRQNDITELYSVIDCLKGKVAEGEQLKCINEELTAKCDEYIAKYK